MVGMGGVGRGVAGPCAAISVLCFIRSGPGLSGQLVYPSVVPAACACHL